MQNNIYHLEQEQLEEVLAEWKQPSFRHRQIWAWLYEKGAKCFSQMSNLPKGLRTKLAQHYHIGEFEISVSQSSQDGTQKRLYRLVDGRLIESVLMPYADGRRTACISSQAGCAMGCVFCATGQMGYIRQLSAHEIFEQAAVYSAWLQERGERLSNIVLMGMGEPFHNYEAVITAIQMIMERLQIGARRITVSTVGLVPQIRRFAQEKLQVKLAISLHCSTDEQRGALMPINRKYPIADLIAACREYITLTNRRITFEWALIEGKNDNKEEAQRLSQLLCGLKCHVNLIPLNPTGGYGGKPSGQIAAQQFISILERSGVPATIRIRRGIDIDAGCGQLKSKSNYRKVLV